MLRHWESVGLVAPDRTASGERRYGAHDLYRIAVVLRAKEAGLALDDIATMLTCDATERILVLQRRRDELATEIAAAQQSLELIDCALACDHEDIAECRHFHEHVTARMAEFVVPHQHG